MADGVQLGSVVTDREGDGEIPGLVVEVLSQTADRYVLRASSSVGDDLTVADQNINYPADDPVAMVLFDPILRQHNPDWREERQAVISSYRQGSFRSAINPLPLSRLRPIEQDGEEGGLRQPASLS